MRCGYAYQRARALARDDDDDDDDDDGDDAIFDWHQIDHQSMIIERRWGRGREEGGNFDDFMAGAEGTDARTETQNGRTRARRTRTLEKAFLRQILSCAVPG